MIVEISQDLRPRINGTLIQTARSVPELHALVGTPSRIVDPRPPAPLGHRNNQIHVFDTLGIYFLEHHHTRRIHEATLVFSPAEEGFIFTPATSFTGKLTLAAQDIPQHPKLIDVLKPFSKQIAPLLGGIFHTKSGQFSLTIDSKGPKLRSGKRSRVRQLVALAFSWPHDDLGKPVVAE